jgi:hypothetical protein
MDDRHHVSKFNQVQVSNINSFITLKEIEAVVFFKNPPNKKKKKKPKVQGPILPYLQRRANINTPQIIPQNINRRNTT